RPVGRRPRRSRRPPASPSGSSDAERTRPRGSRPAPRWAPGSRNGCSAITRRPRATRSSSACRGTRWSSGGARSSWNASPACTCTAPGTWALRCETRGGASVPRSGPGRGQDRDRPHRQENQGEDPMTVVKSNRLADPAGQSAELEKRFAARKHSVDQAPGFEGVELLRPVSGEEHYCVVTRWADDESFRAWAAQRAPRDPSQTGSRAEGILECEVVDLE